MNLLKKFRLNVYWMDGTDEQFECTHWALAQGAYNIYYSNIAMTANDVIQSFPSFSIPKENVKYFMCEELDV